MSEYETVKVNGVWRVYNTILGGWVAGIKSSTKDGAIRRIPKPNQTERELE